MKRRRWDSKTKTKIVLEGLSGRPVSEICNEYGIHQNQYYTWRDKFLSEVFGWSFVDYGPDYYSFNNEGIDGGFFELSIP